MNRVRLDQAARMSQSLLHQRTASQSKRILSPEGRERVSIASSSANCFPGFTHGSAFTADSSLNRFFISELLPSTSAATVGASGTKRLNRFFISELLPSMSGFKAFVDGPLKVSIASSSANCFPGRRHPRLRDRRLVSQSLLHQRTASQVNLTSVEDFSLSVSIASSSANCFPANRTWTFKPIPHESQSLLHQRTASQGWVAGPPPAVSHVSIASSSANCFPGRRKWRQWWPKLPSLNRFFISELLPSMARSQIGSAIENVSIASSSANCFPESDGWG